MFERKKIDLTIQDVVKTIELRPRMFFGNDLNIENIEYFILGFLAYKTSNQVSTKIEELFHQEFHTFVSRRYLEKIDHPTSYSRVISIVEEDRQKHLQLFLELFNEFCDLYGEIPDH